MADFDRGIDRIETKLILMLSLLGVIATVMLGGFLRGLGAAGGHVREARRMR